MGRKMSWSVQLAHPDVQVPTLSFSHAFTCSFQEGVRNNKEAGSRIIFWCPGLLRGSLRAAALKSLPVLTSFYSALLLNCTISTALVSTELSSTVISFATLRCTIFPGLNVFHSIYLRKSLMSGRLPPAIRQISVKQILALHIADL